MLKSDSKSAQRAARQWKVVAFIVALVWLLAVASTATAEAADAASQCVVCHTDAAKLKALTPADPPPTEEGEG